MSVSCLPISILFLSLSPIVATMRRSKIFVSKWPGLSRRESSLEMKSRASATCLLYLSSCKDGVVKRLSITPCNQNEIIHSAVVDGLPLISDWSAPKICSTAPVGISTDSTSLVTSLYYGEFWMSDYNVSMSGPRCAMCPSVPLIGAAVPFKVVEKSDQHIWAVAV